MRLFRAPMWLALAVFLVASACGGRGEPTPTPVAIATPIPTQKGSPAANPTVVAARAPGEVRTLPDNLVDEETCNQLGAADAAQDQAAGATEEHASPYADVDTGFLISGFGPQGEGMAGKPTSVAWVASGVVKVEVVELGGSLQLPCAKAYAAGYMGVPFQSS
jgi:hypothetical protein